MIREVPLRFLGTGRGGLFTDGDWVEAPYITDSGNRLIQTGNIGIGRYREQGFRYVSDESFAELRCTEVRPGDVLICRLADPVGRACLAPDLGQRMLTSVDVCICRPRTDLADPRFVVYYLSSSKFLDEVGAVARGGTRQRVSRAQLGSVRIPLLPLEEQRAIADFLDVETARIDALIDKKRRLITLLDERLLSMRDVSVTGAGKASGIPSLPTVPDSWLMLRNKTFLVEATDPSPDGLGEMLSVSHLTGVTPRSEKTVYMFEAESTVGYKRVQPGDLVINTMWAWMGAAGVSSHYGIVSPAYGVYRFHSGRVEPEFYEVLIRAPGYIEEMTRFSRGVTSSRLRLYPDEFLRLRAPVPPLTEQRRIARQVLAWQRAHSDLVSRTKHQIALLEEKRRALITAAVTGEFAVPGSAAA